MGRNGAGKSTLLRALVGLTDAASGKVRVGGEDPATLSGEALTAVVGMVPQDPGDLLWNESVRAELVESSDPGLAARTVRRARPRGRSLDPPT